MNVASTLKTALCSFVVLFLTPPPLWADVHVEREQGTLLKIVSADVAESGQKSVLLRDAQNGDLLVVPIENLSKAEQKIVAQFESGAVVDIPKIAIRLGKNVERGEKYAILIGVDQYQHPINQLNCCEKDMKLLAETFRANGFAEENVFLLTSDGLPPTKKNVERLLTTLLPALSPNDTIVVAFSGHGIMLDFNGERQSYFCPTDAQIERDSLEEVINTLVARSFVDQALLNSPARSKVLICDACRLENTYWLKETEGKTFPKRNTRPDNASPTPTASNDARFCVLSSCMPGGASFTTRNEHSVFIWFLNEGLLGFADLDASTGGNNDGSVGVQEAFNYAQFKTRKYVELRYHGAGQIPTFAGTLDDDFELTVP